MKVRPVNFNSGNVYGYYPLKMSVESKSEQNYDHSVNDLSFLPFVYPITFTSIQNSSKMRILFEYDLPCMYSGVTMIDSKKVSKLLKNRTFVKPAKESVSALNTFKDSVTGNEAELLRILNDRAKVHPEKNIQELLKEISPFYMKVLRKQQSPIFYELSMFSKDLPPNAKKQFEALMNKTNEQLNDRPTTIPFSSFEFRYKLAKIKDDILAGNDLKAKKAINKIIKESKKLADSTNPSTIELQKEVIDNLELIQFKTVLKDNEQLSNLIQTSKARLKNKEIIVPFSRKSFLYDLSKVLSGIENEELKEKMICKALELPTSNQSFAAYFMKVISDPPEKIAYRILWPSIASVEHIHPKSCGGADEMYNFGGATTRENSERKSMDFVEWMELKPEISKNCQKYVDRLIELYHQGVFAKHNINPKYIVDFKNAIYEESKHKLVLDISKMDN